MTDNCEFEDGCMMPDYSCGKCLDLDELQSYNWLYLRGDKHINDRRYQEMCKEEGIDIPDELLYTPAINDSYVAMDPEKNGAYIKKKMAEHGLLEEKIDE